MFQVKFLITYKRATVLFLSIVLCITLFVKCTGGDDKNAASNSTETTDTTRAYITKVDYTQFAGSASCKSCHSKIYNSYIRTLHYGTSRVANANTIKGSFIPGNNSFIYTPEHSVVMEKRDSGFYQVGYFRGAEQLSRRFDIIIGSGKRGETYLSWVNNKLIELPVSYFTQVHQWANSPGYPRYPVIFNRPATTRCLECHSTFAGTVTPPMQEPEKFDSAKMILTVSCEKCHGPAARHVAYQSQNPKDTIAKFIINPARLSNKLATDVCALCHAGRLQKTQPSFQFTAGDPLSEFFKLNDSLQNPGNVDVHGNQLSLLASSKCFRLSKNLTCVTCHNPHNNETNNKILFSQRCISCHADEHKTITGITGDQLIKNCVDCHMPEQPSRSIIFLLQDKPDPVHASMHTHFITVYPDETIKFIQQIKAHKSRKS